MSSPHGSMADMHATKHAASSLPSESAVLLTRLPANPSSPVGPAEPVSPLRPCSPAGPSFPSAPREPWSSQQQYKVLIYERMQASHSKEDVRELYDNAGLSMILIYPLTCSGPFQVQARSRSINKSHANVLTFSPTGPLRPCCPSLPLTPCKEEEEGNDAIQKSGSMSHPVHRDAGTKIKRVNKWQCKRLDRSAPMQEERLINSVVHCVSTLRCRRLPHGNML